MSLTHAFGQGVGVGKFHAVKTINIPCFSSFHLPGRFLLILYFQCCLSILLWARLLHTQAVMMTFPAIAVIFHFPYRDICHLEQNMKCPS